MFKNNCDSTNTVWESNLFSKIDDPRPSYVLGNLLEVATEIALKRIDVSYVDLTDEYQSGHVPDFETHNTVIECKNLVGSVKSRYRVDCSKFQNQIRPRFYYSGCKNKILILPTGVKWDQSALDAVRDYGIIIVYCTPVVRLSDVLFASMEIERELRDLGVFSLKNYSTTSIGTTLIRVYYHSLYDISHHDLESIKDLLASFEPPFEEKFIDQLMEGAYQWSLAHYENLGC